MTAGLLLKQSGILHALLAATLKVLIKFKMLIWNCPQREHAFQAVPSSFF
jgi:hypothetical protein